MKPKKKKRDPRKEPFPSKRTDAERHEILLRASASDHNDEDIDMLLDDHKRALAKQRAALKQAATPIEEWQKLGITFAVPDLSEASASATASVLIGPIEDWAREGAKTKRQRKRAGFATHSPMNEDPKTKAKHLAWEAARRAILGEWTGAPVRAPSGRKMARLIAKRVPDSNEHTVRGWMSREKKKGRSNGKRLVK